MLKSLAFAGNHTSSILQSNAVWLLARFPEQFDRLKRREVSIRAAVDEVLRYKGTFRGVTRIAKRSGQIHGIPYLAGDYLLTWLTSANWDEDKFIRPHVFDVGRSPNGHLAFAVGNHYCIGAQIARLELECVLEFLTAHVRAIDLRREPNVIKDPWVDGFLNLEVRLCQ